jgi:hypothetical protein
MMTNASRQRRDCGASKIEGTLIVVDVAHRRGACMPASGVGVRSSVLMGGGNNRAEAVYLESWLGVCAPSRGCLLFTDAIP